MILFKKYSLGNRHIKIKPTELKNFSGLNAMAGD